MENTYKTCLWENDDGGVCGCVCSEGEDYCVKHIEESKNFIRGLLEVYLSDNKEDIKRLNREVKGWKKIVEDSVSMTKYKLKLFIDNKRDNGLSNEVIMNLLI